MGSITICVMVMAISSIILIRYSWITACKVKAVKKQTSDEKIYDEYMEGMHRKVIVNSISYTGWKLVGVMPYSILQQGWRI